MANKMLLFALGLIYLQNSALVCGSQTLVQVGQLKMSQIGVGTWSWGNQFLWGYSEREDGTLQNVYNSALSRGLTWFDTADSYGTGALSGRSEKLLGKFAANRSNKANAHICTKLAPFPWRIGSSSVQKCITDSQCRLGRPISMLQLHWPPALDWQLSAYLDAFSAAIENKQALQLGASNFGPRGLRKFQSELQARGCLVHSNQVQFSLLSRQPLTSGLLDTCKEMGVQPIAYSPLALGLLADKYSLARLPTGPRNLLFREYLPSVEPLLGELRDIARVRRKTVAQVALNWTMSKGFLVLVGMRTVQQVEDNTGAMGWSLSPAELECIDIAASRLRKSLIQNPSQGD